MTSDANVPRAFRVRFIVDRVEQPVDVQVDPRAAAGRAAHDGLPGSLLQIALSAAVPIDHACGGVGVCGTCHVIVEQGFDGLAPADEAEEDALDAAAGVTRLSRLACQAVPTGACDLVVRVPAWNRNE